MVLVEAYQLTDWRSEPAPDRLVVIAKTTRYRHEIQPDLGACVVALAHQARKREPLLGSCMVRMFLPADSSLAPINHCKARPMQFICRPTGLLGGKRASDLASLAPAVYRSVLAEREPLLCVEPTKARHCVWRHNSISIHKQVL